MRRPRSPWATWPAVHSDKGDRRWGLRLSSVPHGLDMCDPHLHHSHKDFFLSVHVNGHNGACEAVVRKRALRASGELGVLESASDPSFPNLSCSPLLSGDKGYCYLILFYTGLGVTLFLRNCTIYQSESDPEKQKHLFVCFLIFQCQLCILNKDTSGVFKLIHH